MDRILDVLVKQFGPDVAIRVKDEFGPTVANRVEHEMEDITKKLPAFDIAREEAEEEGLPIPDFTGEDLLVLGKLLAESPEEIEKRRRMKYISRHLEARDRGEEILRKMSEEYRAAVPLAKMEKKNRELELPLPIGLDESDRFFSGLKHELATSAEES